MTTNPTFDKGEWAHFNDPFSSEMEKFVRVVREAVRDLYNRDAVCKICGHDRRNKVIK